MRRVVPLCVLLASTLLAAPFPAAASGAIFTVNGTGDLADNDLSDSACDTTGVIGLQCTLRAAIQEANDEPGADRIEFAVVGGPVVKVFTPDSPYDELTKPVTIDGYTQGDASPNTNPVGVASNAVLRVELEGQDAPSGTTGFFVGNNASNVVIRGIAIGNFDSDGIRIAAGTGTGNRVIGNFIGTDAAGTGSLPNGDSGVQTIGGGCPCEIGGSVPADSNFIRGNPGPGIEAGERGTAVSGNRITLNQGGGVEVTEDAVVGGRKKANAIFSNTIDGILVTGSGTEADLLRNSLNLNGGLGIDLGDDGVTANDPKDPDGGPNGLQNFPVLSSATIGGGKVTIAGKLASRKNRRYTIELFASDPGENEAETFLGKVQVETNARGKATFTKAVDAQPATTAITATATGPNGTSEISAPIAATP